MSSVVRAGLNQILSLGGVGLLTGAVAGWVGILSAEGREAVAARVAGFYWALLVLLPAMVLLWAWASRQGSQRMVYQDMMGRAMAVALIVGMLGAVLATLAYVAVATQVAVLFGRLDGPLFQQALYARLGRSTMVALVGVTVAFASIGTLGAYLGTTNKED